MRYSKQRELIQDIVQETNSHPTAYWIFNKAKRKISNISLGTVYRNLNKLNKDGVIEEYSMECNFRKPNPGMLFSAAEKHNIELSRSIIVGDKESDLLAGRNANLHSCYLIRSSNSESPSESIYAKKAFNNLNDFVFNFLCK